MLDPKMEKELNKQINEEFYSSYLYLAMSTHFNAEGLQGFAHWLRAHAPSGPRKPQNVTPPA